MDDVAWQAAAVWIGISVVGTGVLVVVRRSFSGSMVVVAGLLCLIIGVLWDDKGDRLVLGAVAGVKTIGLIGLIYGIVAMVRGRAPSTPSRQARPRAVRPVPWVPPDQLEAWSTERLQRRVEALARLPSGATGPSADATAPMRFQDDPRWQDAHDAVRSVLRGKELTQTAN